MQNLPRVAIAALLLLVLSEPVPAQTRLTTVQTAGTIAVTDTFQQLLPLQDGRFGCTIQNQGSNTMFVFFGTTAAATKAKSFQVLAGQSISCAVGANLLSDPVQITGTSTDAYVVSNQ